MSTIAKRGLWWKPSEDTSIFIEHKPIEIDPVQKQLALVDAQVSVLTKGSRQAQWDADKLALARDLAQPPLVLKVFDGEGVRQQSLLDKGGVGTCPQVEDDHGGDDADN